MAAEASVLARVLSVQLRRLDWSVPFPGFDAQESRPRSSGLILQVACLYERG